MRPFLRRLWPKTKNRLTPGVSAEFAQLCLVADGAFPQVFREVRAYLSGGNPASDHLVYSFSAKGYSGRFPAESLEFLCLVLEGANGVFPEDLRECLRAIRSAQPVLEETAMFQRLVTLAGGTL